MRYTENLHLKLPEYTDAIDVEDLNNNFTAIAEGVDSATSRQYILEAPSSGWTSGGGGFTQTFQVSGVTEDMRMSGCLCAVGIESATIEAKRKIIGELGEINEIVTSNGAIALVCYNRAPSVDLTVVVTQTR